MRWIDHERIASAIASRFNLPKEELIKGCIEPDKNREREEYHHGNLGELWYNLLIARKYFLLDSQEKMPFYLGKALHYVHDTCIVSERSGIFTEERVKSIEDNISSFAIPKGQIEKGFKDRQSSPIELAEKIRELNSLYSNKPEDIMRKAAYYSALVTGSIRALQDKKRDKKRLLRNQKKYMLKNSNFF
jgi:hypothetical protein